MSVNQFIHWAAIGFAVAGGVFVFIVLLSVVTIFFDGSLNAPQPSCNLYGSHRDKD